MLIFLLVLLLELTAHSTMAITIQGRHFIRDGERLVLKGVVYQPHRVRGDRFNPNPDILDPLRDECLDDVLDDIELFKELGINAIKVYILYPHLAHDAAFEALKKAGILVLVGLSTPQFCINRMRPHESYTPELVDHYCGKIDMLAKHENVLGVVVANSIVNNAKMAHVGEIRQTMRNVINDLKRHMDGRSASGQRALPLGIADSTYAASSTESVDYFTAGASDEVIDFYSFTKYSRVIDANTHWDDVLQRFDGKNIPIFVSEYGENGVRPRTFAEVDSLYSDEALRVLSGAFVYDFVEGANRYGLIKADGERLGDFENLKQRYAKCGV